MSTAEDVDRFLAFLEETFIAREDSAYAGSDCNGSTAPGKLEHSERLSTEPHECVPQAAASTST
jgi:hypothetical protein